MKSSLHKMRFRIPAENPGPRYLMVEVWANEAAFPWHYYWIISDKRGNRVRDSRAMASAKPPQPGRLKRGRYKTARKAQTAGLKAAERESRK